MLSTLCETHGTCRVRIIPPGSISRVYKKNLGPSYGGSGGSFTARFLVVAPFVCAPWFLFIFSVNDWPQVAPSKFTADAKGVVTAEIEAKFADRVIPKVGLCVCLHSYESIGDPYVYPSDGSAHYKVYM